MTIDELYRFVQFLANKDQRGFIKPSEFNLAATRAQLDIIEEKFKSENTHKNLDDLAPVVEKLLSLTLMVPFLFLLDSCILFL